MKLSEFLKSINQTKAPLLDDVPEGEKLYPPFIVNRCLSYFPDTVLLANQMNMVPDIDHKMQFDFLRLAAQKRNRYSPWVKAETSDDLELLKRHYKINHTRAKQYVEMLTEEDIQRIRDLYGMENENGRTAKRSTSRRK